MAEQRTRSENAGTSLAKKRVATSAKLPNSSLHLSRPNIYTISKSCPPSAYSERFGVCDVICQFCRVLELQFHTFKTELWEGIIIWRSFISALFYLRADHSVGLGQFSRPRGRGWPCSASEGQTDKVDTGNQVLRKSPTI